MKEKTMKPTKKQLFLAKKLGISGAEYFSRRELAIAIEQALKEKQNKENKEEIGLDDKKEKLEDVEYVYEYYGNTNVQEPILIEISLTQNKENFELMKKKKLYPSSPSLWEEFIAFLKRVGAVRKGNSILIRTGGDDDVYSPSYILSCLESFFIEISWRYTS